MSVTRTLSNHFKAQMGAGAVDFSNSAAGAFRVILMDDVFAFDRTTHDTYADVKASELATLNGYTRLDKALVIGSAWAKDDVSNNAEVAWDNVMWTAAGGSFGPTGAAIVLQYDPGDAGGTGDVGDDSLVIGCIDFGQDYTLDEFVSFQLQDIGFVLAQGT